MTLMSNLFQRNGVLTQEAAKPLRTLPLSMAGAGQALELLEIQAGRQLTHRLAEMGLTRGVMLRVVQDAGGPLLISVRGSRVAMGRGMAHKLIVRSEK